MSLSMAQRRYYQVLHILHHRAAFVAHQTMERNVTDYFDEYWDPNNPNELYLNLCTDLGLTPRKEALQ